MIYLEDDFLMISGIQHYAYCKRQWGLIHIENQWESNVYTVRGDITHEKVDDPFIMETRGDLIVSRSVPIYSSQFGCYGIADLLEYTKALSGVKLEGREGYYKIYPIEYKVGKPKENEYDLVQLCLQALCLEEMYNVRIEEGAMYYAKIKRRVRVHFDEGLRNLTIWTINEMHEIIDDNRTPEGSYEAKCDHCSLYNVCLPKTVSKMKKVETYINDCLKVE